MAVQMIHTIHAPAAIGPYSQAVRTGSLLMTSGQLGLIPETGILPEGENLPKSRSPNAAT